MPVNIIMKEILFKPDASRVIARFLYTTDERSMELITRILQLTEKEQLENLTQVLRDYSKRHRSISRIFEKHFTKLFHLFAKLNIPHQTLTLVQKLLVGAYFTMEYSIEAAAFLTPQYWKIRIRLNCSPVKKD